MIVFRLIGHANGMPSKYDGWYLASMDFEAYDGRGDATFCQNSDKALKFPDMAKALAFYKTSPAYTPLRADGKPNRPMTASTWDIHHV